MPCPSQVRGYSIELLAVQKALQEMKELVSDAIVVADGDAAATEKTLIAYGRARLFFFDRAPA
jgi:hypothetical protein